MSQPVTGSDALASEHAQLTLDGQPLEVMTLRGREAVSELFRYDLRCRQPDGGATPGQLVGREARIALGDGHGAERSVVGLVAEARLRRFAEDYAELSLVVRPLAHRLTLGRDSRLFHDMSVVDIAADVLQRAGASARFELTEEYDARRCTAQHDESDWRLLLRLLAEEGIYHWHDEQGVMVLSDRSTAAPELAGGGVIPFVAESALSPASEAVFELGAGCAAQPTKFSLRSFDAERPRLSLEASVGEGSLEIYDARGAGPASPEACRRRSQLSQQAAACERATVTGHTSCLRMLPGRTVVIEGHPFVRLDGRYFIVETTIEITQRQRGPQGPIDRPPEARFAAVPGPVPFRPAAQQVQPRQSGLAIGQVVGPPGEEVHPDSAGRVRVQHHWDRQGHRDDKAGRWMRVAQRGTAGSLLLPRMGWHVMTAAEEGSVDAPLLLNRFFDAEHPPPYALPEHKTRTSFRTATTPGDGTYNEIRFDDAEGREEMFINATGDMSILVQDAKTEQVEADSRRQIGHDASRDVGRNFAETVVADQTTQVAGDDSESVGAARQQLVSGSEADEVGATRQVEVGETHITSVSDRRELFVGAAQMDVSLASIAANAPSVHALVGGCALKLTLSSMSETVGMGLSYGPVSGPAAGGVLQTVAGSKVELTDKSRSISAASSLTETVAGAMTHTTLGAYKDISAGSLKLQASAIKVAAEQVVIKGDSAVVITCGDSKIVLDSSGIQITSPAVDLTNSCLAEASSDVEVTIN